MPEEEFNAFKGFTWHRRTLPLTTLARGRHGGGGSAGLGSSDFRILAAAMASFMSIMDHVWLLLHLASSGENM